MLEDWVKPGREMVPTRRECPLYEKDGGDVPVPTSRKSNINMNATANVRHKPIGRLDLISFADWRFVS